MPRQLHEKSTVEEIRQRFDADVERFSKLETGQQAAMDSAVILDIVARSAACHIRPHGKLLDLGCGAGNFTLRVLGQVSPLDCVLVDLSQPMLERAEQRVKAATLRPGGTLFVADFVAYDDAGIQELMLARYAEHLVNLGGPEYRDKVLAYCEAEDSPRSTKYQFDLLAKAGFKEFEILHKNALFAAFYAKKRG